MAARTVSSLMIAAAIVVLHRVVCDCVYLLVFGVVLLIKIA